MGKTIVTQLAARLYIALFFILVLSTVAAYVAGREDLVVERPEWVQGGHTLGRDEVMEYVRLGLVRVDGSTDPISTETTYTELLEYGRLIVDVEWVDNIYRYIDSYETKAGRSVYFLRDVYSSKAYTVEVSRDFRRVASVDTMVNSYPDVFYRTRPGLETRQFSFKIDVCTVPGVYNYEPKGIYEVSFLNQSILTRRHEVEFPPLRITVVLPDLPDYHCMISKAAYRDYFWNLHRSGAITLSYKFLTIQATDGSRYSDSGR